MGMIGGLLGGGSGSGFQAQGMNTDSGVSGGDLFKAQQNTEDAQARQKAFLDALNAQNGIQKQTDVFGQEQNLANTLGAQSRGEGPNVALNQLNQTTAANTANQAALMAGQRGASQNAGLLARQAAMQGGANQQMAAGQAATMRAQQQLAAQSALQNQQGAMANLSSNMVGNQATGIQNYNQNAQAQQNAFLHAREAQNGQQTQMQSNMNSANSNVAQQNAGFQGNMIGGLASGLGGAAMKAIPSMFSSTPASQGVLGESAHVAGGGPQMAAEGGVVQGPKSFVGAHLKGMPQPQVAMAHGGKVPALVSPGEVYLPPKKAQKVAKGKADPIKAGEKIPGKAKIKGNSYANDTVPKDLEAGGVVIPRSVMESKNPAKEAAAFVQAHLSRNNPKKK